MQIDTFQSAESALGSALFLLFKHSNRCGVSSRAFAEFEAFLAEHDIESGWVDVVADRALSMQISQSTGVEHKSPQALLIRDGEVEWHASHFDITKESLSAALPPPNPKLPAPHNRP